MKTFHHQKKSKKTLVIVLCITLVLAAGGSTYAYYALTKDSESKDSSQNTEPDSVKNSSSDNSSNPQEQIAKDENQTPIQYEGKNPNDSQTITGTINQASVSGSNLVIRVTINQLLGSGNCTLTLTNSAQKTVVKNAEIIADPSTSSCKGFDIPLSELEPGKWNFTINVSSGNKTGLLTGEAII